MIRVSMCKICDREFIPTRMITLTEGHITYKIRGCESCGAWELIEPKPKTLDWYTSGDYRKEVPRTSEAVRVARAGDAMVCTLLQKKIGYKRFIVLDVCAEDESVREWRLLGEDSIYRTHGIRMGGVHNPLSYTDLESVPKRTHDIITCLVSFEHMEDPVQFLGELVRLVKNGGRVMASVPYIRHEPEGLTGKGVLKPHHTWYFNRKAFIELMSRHTDLEMWVHNGETQWAIGRVA